MAAVFFNSAAQKGDAIKLGESLGYRKKLIAEFLTERGWVAVGNRTFHSNPSTCGTEKEQLLFQAKALQDIEDLVSWRPLLKECFDDAVVIVGHAYRVGSLINNETPIAKEGKAKDCCRALRLSLKPNKGDAAKEDKKNAVIANGRKPITVTQHGVKSPEKRKMSTRPENGKMSTRPARNRPMGSASKVTSHSMENLPKTPAAAVKNKPTARILLASRTDASDINSNNLSREGCSLKGRGDEMTPLYLGALNDHQENGDGSQCDCNGYHVETFVKLDSCARKFHCANVNINPSERVVV